MATLDWDLTRTGEVTLVELAVGSEFDQHVCIESQLTPVWPPRRQGVPQRGWDGSTFEGTVSQDSELVFGYASPAEPAEPPATITATEPPSADETVRPRDIVHTLGDASPPRDTFGRTHSEKSERPPVTQESTETDQATQVETEPRQGSEHGTDTEHQQPREPTAWFDAVESRVTTTEQLARTTDAGEVRAAVDELGGIEDIRALQAQLNADRRRLTEVQQRSETLAERLASVELPLATLERIV